MMTLPYPYSSSARFYALRLLPGQEVLSQLRAFAQQQQLHAAWIAGCTGSLTDVALRYAGQENTALLSGKFEVIALNGTLEQSGEHLHLCVSDPHGTMLGGHMMPGCTVRTTLELVIGCLEELAFSRQLCALSGYDELHISPLNNYFQRGFLMARRHFSSQALVLIVISIAINMIGGQLASMVKLPIFLDSIGTLISAVLLGPVIGMLTGLLTNLLWGLLTDPIAAAFAPVAMVIGLVAGWLARAGWFRTLPKVVVSGVIITLAVTVVAVPLRTALFGGVTGSGADLFVAWMHSMGQNLVESVAITVIGANLVDKILTAVIVWLYCVSCRFAPRAIFRQWLPCDKCIRLHP